MVFPYEKAVDLTFSVALLQHIRRIKNESHVQEAVAGIQKVVAKQHHPLFPEHTRLFDAVFTAYG